MKSTSQTGAAFLAGGSIAGVGISSTVGGIEIVGSFGGMGIGATPYSWCKLARFYHPDVNGSASDKAAMQAINHAYQEFQSKK
ncbi:MAG: J domain-containing protein [Trichormus sp. ATA11-4-KO1]|jgi:hypothetical protein|nr:J domain-containing protein [Trichormus sp. ATA11-4-KO1]